MWRLQIHENEIVRFVSSTKSIYVVYPPKYAYAYVRLSIFVC